MEVNYTVILVTIINVVLLTAVGVVLYKAAKSFKRFVERNREIDKKVDIILKKLEESDSK
ncbi:hypothetical protein [Clostridium sp. UBA4548]|uniref:hypothetical protein n=1 Tax=Clostridium sp. UBA4548 TaxID=1946361 RepID=UPI0025C135C6|nr:hypothetical protein [Clostridium sp. UBA4548]